VVVVTAYDAAGDVVGMTLGSFTSVSLDPPLVAFLPSVTSNSWKSLRDTGVSYGINILGNDQESVCRAVAMKKERKFEDIETYRSPYGNPVIAGSVAFIDCSATQIHDAGDHQIVVCEVEDLHILDGEDPLLFFRGGYGSFVPQSLTAYGPGLLDRLTRVDVVRPIMDELATTFDTEVTISSLVGDQIVVLAATGRTRTDTILTRLGARFPFVAPIGALYAAWGDAGLREHWMASVPSATPEERAQLLARIDRIRERGYSVNIGHAVNERLFRLAAEVTSGTVEVTKDELGRSFQAEQSMFDPSTLSDDDRVEFRSVSAPVLDSAGRVALTLLLWGPPEEITWSAVKVYVDALVAAAKRATEALSSIDAEV
jgi:flavin reductase (DIM6/NTAB) family NADH-FMN oxidoreductase RutF/DNA-binding IclR family transcriptional regulator